MATDKLVGAIAVTGAPAPLQWQVRVLGPQRLFFFCLIKGREEIAGGLTYFDCNESKQVGCRSGIPLRFFTHSRLRAAIIKNVNLRTKSPCGAGKPRADEIMT